MSNKRTEGAGLVIADKKIVLDYDETNEALGVAGREARVAVPGCGGSVRSDVVAVRPVAPGYGGFGKRLVKGLVEIPGYGISSVTTRIVRFPNS